MGTNYYYSVAEGNICPHCGRGDRMSDDLHIGKSSAGWNFSLHVYPEDGINTLEDWIVKFDQPLSRISNTYGEKVSKKEMLEIITERSWVKSDKIDYDWYRENHAHEGINGLAAHNVDGHYCIGTVIDGTWDYIVGDFS